MHLKPYLRKSLNDRISGYKVRIELTEESLRVLEGTNTGRACYTVYLRSLWENEGEKSTTTEYTGTLKNAIEKAEAEFEAINHRHDGQTDCSVEIRLGEDSYSIPEEYWQKFQEISE